MDLMRKCVAGNHYTLKRSCHGAETINPHPPKFDPKDRHAKYRRKALGIE